VTGVSIVDVARRAGVSKSTVSRVLTRQPGVHPATLERVESAMRELAYRPNALARGLVAGRTHTLGLVVFSLHNPYFGLLAQGVEAAARARGYNVLIMNSAESEAQQQDCLDMLAERRVDGVAIVPIRSEDEEIAAIHKAGLKAVLLNSTAGDASISSVGTDNEQGACLATRHLLDLGHRRIGILGHLRSISGNRERLRGYQRAHERAGIPADGALVAQDLLRLERVRAAVAEMLDLADPPTAFFAVNDELAIAALQALIERGCRVPDDIALVGYDDLPVAAWLSVPLTTVAQPNEELGRIGADLLIDLIENPQTPVQRMVLQPRLVVRQSCGAALAKRKGGGTLGMLA